MYNQYLRNYENMKEFYIERMKALNELYVQSLQNFIKINEQYRELFKGNENANTLYKAYVDNFQKLNKQWADSLWAPSLSVNRKLTDGDDDSYDIPELIDELGTNYPLVSAILDKVPEMDLEEAGTLVLLVDGVRWLGKMHALRLLRMQDKTVTDEMMQIKTNEIKGKHPLLANILDRIQQMNLKETYTGLLVLDVLEHILKAHQVQVIREKGL
jgi:hypothetical protein